MKITHKQLQELIVEQIKNLKKTVKKKFDIFQYIKDNKEKYIANPWDFSYFLLNNYIDITGKKNPTKKNGKFIHPEIVYKLVKDLKINKKDFDEEFLEAYKTSMHNTEYIDD